MPERFPDILLDDPERARRELSDVHAAGGRVVVEATPIGLGRRPRALAELARGTGVVVVAATGFQEAYYPADHWIRAADVDQLTRVVTTDLITGMDAADLARTWPEPTTVRAGVVKVATELHHMTPLQHRLFEAAARAHRATGAPLTTHCEHGTHGIEQVATLGALGVRADAVMVGHVCKNPTPATSASSPPRVPAWS